jgi:hypothetical protein
MGHLAFMKEFKKGNADAAVGCIRIALILVYKKCHHDGGIS